MNGSPFFDAFLQEIKELASLVFIKALWKIVWDYL